MESAQARDTQRVFGVHPIDPAMFHDLADHLGIEVAPELLILDGSLVEFLGSCREVGAEAEAVSHVSWQAEYVAFSDQLNARLDAGAGAMGGEFRPGQRIANAFGAFRVRFRSICFLVVGYQSRELDIRLRRPMLAILGPSGAAIRDFAGFVLSSIPDPQLQVWGSARRRPPPQSVTETDLVLCPVLRHEMFRWLDRFWGLAGRAETLGIAPRKGLLLIGDPGTGKTQCVRHILARYPGVNAHLFIPGRRTEAGDPFGDMLNAIQVQRRPAIIVIEDIDRLADSGAVTAQYLLNCLDGLFAAESPTLWVATANDPSLLEKNLIDRPGRFDRIMVFPRPAADQRRELISRFSRLELEPSALEAAVGASDGLTGAHLREACSTAMLASIDGDGCYGELLPRELDRLRRQHADARRFQAGVNRERVGFND